MESSSVRFLCLSFVGALALGGAFSLGQSTPASQPARPDVGSALAKVPVDLSWLHEFVGPYSGKDIKWDPRFQALITSSLHQRQSIWRDHGKVVSLPDLVQVFIGTPRSVLVDEDRFYTIEGCVPHDCTDKGMVWIDNASAAKPAVIFIAMSSVNTAMGEHGDPIHLWLFSSTALNWQKLPPNFLLRLNQWWLETQSYSKSDVDDELALVTIVQPDGETVDLTPALLASLEAGGTK
jgi:hypothetical protein